MKIHLKKNQSQQRERHGLGDGAWGDWRWCLGWVDELGPRNISAMRELVGELRDKGDAGVGPRAIKEKKLRKKEERRKARERERERERESKGNIYLMKK